MALKTGEGKSPTRRGPFKANDGVIIDISGSPGEFK